MVCRTVPPAHGVKMDPAGQNKSPPPRLTKARGGLYNGHTKRRCRLTVSPPLDV
nr:MAG TPA: hypothetical protein [Caudoviricetes sp.]